MIVTNWTVRRRLIFGTLGGCALGLVYLMVEGGNDQLHLSISNGLFLLFGTTLTSYLGIATWDDKNIMNAPK